jgi:hypothetical protein
MWRQIASGLSGLMLALMVAWLLFAVAMRMKLQPVLSTVRRMNRTVFNPRTMKTADSQELTHQ